MSKQTLEILENEYLAKRKRYLVGQNQIYEFQKKAKQRTEELTAYVHHVYRDSNTVDVKSYLNEMMNNLEQMNRHYQQQLDSLEIAVQNEKKQYNQERNRIEETIQEEKSDNNEIA